MPRVLRGGLGIVFHGREHGGLKVKHFILDGPAARSDLLLPGDIVLRVDGHDTQQRQDGILEHFMGGDGTLAWLEVSRRNAAGKRTPVQVDIQRMACFQADAAQVQDCYDRIEESTDPELSDEEMIEDTIRRVQSGEFWSHEFGPTRSAMTDHYASAKFQVLDDSHDDIPTPPSPTITEASQATDQLNRAHSLGSNFSPRCPAQEHSRQQTPHWQATILSPEIADLKGDLGAVSEAFNQNQDVEFAGRGLTRRESELKMPRAYSKVAAPVMAMLELGARVQVELQRPVNHSSSLRDSDSPAVMMPGPVPVTMTSTPAAAFPITGIVQGPERPRSSPQAAGLTQSNSNLNSKSSGSDSDSDSESEAFTESSVTVPVSDAAGLPKIEPGPAWTLAGPGLSESHSSWQNPGQPESQVPVPLRPGKLQVEATPNSASGPQTLALPPGRRFASTQATSPPPGPHQALSESLSRPTFSARASHAGGVRVDVHDHRAMMCLLVDVRLLMAKGTRISEGGGHGAVGEIVCRRVGEVGGQGEAAEAVQLTETGHSELGTALQPGGFMWKGAEARRLRVQTQERKGVQLEVALFDSDPSLLPAHRFLGVAVIAIGRLACTGATLQLDLPLRPSPFHPDTSSPITGMLQVQIGFGDIEHLQPPVALGTTA